MNDNANDFDQNIAQDEQTKFKDKNPNLFPADNLIDKMGDNMAESEALVDEHPLWTEKTAELQQNEDD